MTISNVNRLYRWDHYESCICLDKQQISNIVQQLIEWKCNPLNKNVSLSVLTSASLCVWVSNVCLTKSVTKHNNIQGDSERKPEPSLPSHYYLQLLEQDHQLIPFAAAISLLKVANSVCIYLSYRLNSIHL